MIKTLEKHEYHTLPPKVKKVKTYIYRCGHCGSIIQFDDCDIETEMVDTLNSEDYVVCPECKHVITLWLLTMWRHRKGVYKLFHRIKENKEE